MAGLLSKMYGKYNAFLCGSSFLRRLIAFQHKKLPVPLLVFDFIFRSKFSRKLFNFYGTAVFQSPYLLRGKKNLDFWLSRDSLYWHFWRQTDTNDKILKEVLSLDPIKECMGNKELIAVEIGFGIGKNYAKNLKNNNFKKYIAIEPNVYLCGYAKKKFESEKNFEIVNTTISEFIDQNLDFNILFCSGGVFMYADPNTVNRFFESLRGKNVKIIIILNEGTPGNDICREDGTVIYNFRKRLISAGYGDKNFIENIKSGNLYRYFLMN